MPFLYQRYLIKCLLQLCLRETAGEPVERNQQGQPVSIITPQPITVAPQKLFPEVSRVKATLSITVGGFFFFLHIALGGNKLRIVEECQIVVK